MVMAGRWQRRGQVQTKWLASEEDYDLAKIAVEISRTNWKSISLELYFVNFVESPLSEASMLTRSPQPAWLREGHRARGWET